MKLNEHKNPKKQGDAGVGSAIGFFCYKGFNVSIPLTDSQEYDLVVDIEGELKKVQVKTTTYKTPYGKYQVALKTSGGNRSRTQNKDFDHSSVDYLFILTLDEDRYLIPTSSFDNKTALNLNDSYDVFKV